LKDRDCIPKQGPDNWKTRLHVRERPTVNVEWLVSTLKPSSHFWQYLCQVFLVFLKNCPSTNSRSLLYTPTYAHKLYKIISYP